MATHFKLFWILSYFFFITLVLCCPFDGFLMLNLWPNLQPFPSNVSYGGRFSSDFDIMEGDIALFREDGLVDRSAAGTYLIWPNNVIPYSYHKSVDQFYERIIEEAIAHWEIETCIRMVPKQPGDDFWVHFRSDASGCFSFVGRQPSCARKGQPLNIGSGCDSMQVVAHELGHVVGLYHEHSRSDRDQAVHINWANILKGYDEQFKKENDTNLGIPYDYTSLMQYNPWAFSREVLEKKTMVTLDPKYQRLLGVAKGLSFRDKKKINYLYQCNATCLNLEITDCFNGGYLRPFDDDGNCSCECPPTAIGQYCETLNGTDYYDALSPLPCGGNVTQEGFIETPDYPLRLKRFESCVWVIRAPQNKLVRLEIIGFEFFPRNVNPESLSNNRCLQEWVELRLDDPFIGKHFCGADLKPGTILTSTGSRAVIIIMADEGRVGRGLRARVSFVEHSLKAWTPFEFIFQFFSFLQQSLRSRKPF